MTVFPDALRVTDELPFSVNLQKINKAVGYVALLLPIWIGAVTLFTNTCINASISHYYYSRLGSDIFVGSITFVGLLMLFSIR